VVPTLITAIAQEPDSELLLAPNPSSDEVLLDLSSNYQGQVSLRLIDANGRELQNQQIQKSSQQLRHRINIKPLSIGMYYLRIRQGEQELVKRVMKQ